MREVESLIEESNKVVDDDLDDDSDQEAHATRDSRPSGAVSNRMGSAGGAPGNTGVPVGGGADPQHPEQMSLSLIVTQLSLIV